jgi:hypothetical protein
MIPPITATDITVAIKGSPIPRVSEFTNLAFILPLLEALNASFFLVR